MSQKYKLHIIGVVYNEEGKFLVASRGKSESIMPGVYSYHVGEFKFENSKKFEAIESNLYREVKEEAGIEVNYPIYLGSYGYDEQGETVIAVSFLCKFKDGEPKPSSPEVDKLEWKTIEEIHELSTLPIVQEVYQSAWNKLNEKTSLHHLSVAGLILNDKSQYMLVKDPTAKEGENLWTFPTSNFVRKDNPSWETLSKNLSDYVRDKYQVTLVDGAVPFADKSYMSFDDYGGIIEFYIARVMDYQENPEVLWKRFENIDKNEMRSNTFNIFSLAHKFIKTIERN